jgi:hypothetical protein
MALTPEQARGVIELTLKRRMQGFPSLVPSRRGKLPTPTQSAESQETHEQNGKRLAERLTKDLKRNAKAEQEQGAAMKRSTTSINGPKELDDCLGADGVMKKALKNVAQGALTVIDCGSVIVVFPILIATLLCCVADALRQVAKDIYSFIRHMITGPQDWVWLAIFIFASVWLALRSRHDRKTRLKIRPLPQDL